MSEIENKLPSFMGREKMTSLSESVKILIDNLNNDADYRYTWQANLAMSFKDEWYRTAQKQGLSFSCNNIHEISNQAAINFLNILCMESSPTQASESQTEE